MEPSTPPAATHHLWGMEDEHPSTERVFEGEPIPSRSETITVRSVAVSIVLGCTLSIVAMKLALTSGFAPSLAIPAGLLGFFLPRLWIRLMDSCETSQLPFTRQENTVIQTCVVACTSIAYSGGFGTYILGMSKDSAEGGVGSDGLNVEEPHIGRMIVFLLLTSFAGMFAIMPFRNSLIIHRRLTFPSGTATAHLINTMHTPQGAKQASQQVSIGLAACAIIVSNVSTASDLMQDHKTGYITLTSPHTITICQAAGTALGCVVNPVIFWIFYRVYNSGAHDDSNSIGPYAKVYRGISMLGMTENGLPKHTMLLCKIFLALALSISVLREVSTHKQWRVRRYIPSTIGMAVAFFVPPTIPVGMVLGSAVIYLWGRCDRDDMRLMSPAVACGLICGDEFGSLLSSMFTLLKATPPVCIMFLSRGVNQSLDAFLAAKGMPS